MSGPDRGLLEIYSVEQAEHVQRLRGLLDALANSSGEGSAPLINQLLRSAHTLKGASRAVGLESTEELTHRVEGLFIAVRDSRLPFDEGLRNLANRTLDTIEDILSAYIARRSEPDIGGLRAEFERFPSQSSAPPVASPPAGIPSAQDESGENAPAARPEVTPEDTLSPPSELMHVSAGSLDQVIRSASQLLSAAEMESAGVQGLDRNLDLIDQTWREYDLLRRQGAPFLRRNENDPEAAPLIECLNFVDARFRELRLQMRSAAAIARQNSWDLQQRADDLRENAVEVRLTPASAALGHFGAMVRELARQEGKQVEFRAEGLDVRVDRLVLQALRDPVMHLLRNAVFHGIEPEVERVSKGKSPAGLVRLRMRSRGDRIRLFIEDDGRGLDREAVLRKAVQQGLVTPEAAKATSPDELTRLILQPNFSTSGEVSNLAGRGMGLSVVDQVVSQLQGEVRIRSKLNGGLTVSLTVPISISSQHLVLVLAGDQTFALPASLVDRVMRVEPNDIHKIEGRDALMLDGQPVMLAKLSDLLGITGVSEPKSETPWVKTSQTRQVAILASGEERVGILVDQFLDEREVVVKETGLPAGMSGMAAGAFPLENGGVAILLNIAALFSRFHRAGEDSAAVTLPDESPAPLKAPRVLVVDDSATTRSLERSILEANGFEVTLAVDGQEALEILRRQSFDLVISDLNMPRMDGFELLSHLKNSKTYSHLPVILVTSLESREDKERGLALGADAYIVKRKFDQRELLTTVRQIL